VSNWGEISILRSLDDVAALKETEGGPISVRGSATLNRALSDAHLIDRWHHRALDLSIARKGECGTARDSRPTTLVE